ncbi:MAG: hypothetical protein RIA08_07300 [Roseovarius sp.]|uniref:hypothetical protein n=1 Tax=Roseovarius sp. TaxID=1486281 RepID=UPI0032EDFA58
MTPKNERWLDHTGLNLIRIVIGSYFMAISLGLIEGVDHAALFAPLLDDQTARLAGMAVLFILSVVFMSGVALRITALTLALFILCSSVAQTFLGPEPMPLSSFWRDLALVCAVLMSYSTLRRQELRKAALIMRRRAARLKRGKFTTVTPRRVTVRNKSVADAAGKATGRGPDGPDYDRVLRPLIAPTGPIARPEPAVTPRPDFNGATVPANDRAEPQKPLKLTNRLRLIPPPAEAEDDIDNIFSNI